MYRTRKLGFVWLIVILALLTGLPIRSGQAQGAATTKAVGKGGAVASVDKLATQIGIDVLKNGGNAIDAAIAVAAALGVVEPYSCGIGGGGFMVIYLKSSNRFITIDSREEAPASANIKMFNDPDATDGKLLAFAPNRISSGLAVGVPGTVAGWEEALRRYGTKSLSDLLQPSIKLAEDGFAVDATLASQTTANKDRFAAFTSTAALYLKDGNPIKEGEMFKNPDLAKSYKLLAEKGANVFYRGEIARAIVNTVQKPPAVEKPAFRVLPGGMTLDDLENYAVHVRTPVTTDYRGYKVYGMGLPSSGGITPIQTLNMLEGYDLGKLDRATALHHIIEAQRLAFADRGAFLGDPEFVDVPLAGLLSKDYAKERRALIKDKAPADGDKARAVTGDPLKFQKDTSPSKTAASVLVAMTPDTEGVSTTHLTVADKDGNVVSYTFTIESTGGNGMVVPGYGFILNNELTDFDVAETHPNNPEPGKRPRSSMAPTIIVAPDGRVIAFGSPGGSTIITTALNITHYVIDFGMPLDEAIAAPRLSQRNTGSTQVDSGFEKTPDGEALVKLGHVFSATAEIGAATGITIAPDGTMLAAAEPKRRGSGAAMVVQPAN